jgi:hypothetical protein
MVIYIYTQKKKERGWMYARKKKYQFEASASSAQPQGYLESISLQSKIGFLSRSFTLLCIVHSH